MSPALRQQVRRRARGRCEYCRIPLLFVAIPPEVDHVIARQHGGKTVFGNLAMTCAHCNAFKGPNVAGVDPRSRRIVRLFHPRRDKWRDHFRYDGAVLQGLTPEGRATVRTLFINDPLEVAARSALMEEGVF